MSKIKLVISTEYKTRVMKKSFILLTLLMPLLFAAVIFFPILIAKSDSEIHTIALVDNDGRFSDIWHDSEEYDVVIDLVEEKIQKVDDIKSDESHSATVLINPKEGNDSIKDLVSLTIVSSKTLPNSVVKYLEGRISTTITDNRLALIASKALLQDIANAECSIKAQTIKQGADGKAEKGAKTEIAMAIGSIATMLIYMFIFISGAQVMQAVIQEKSNRIVEVMLSAIRPWELMWGKLIAVALVCLTQIIIWAAFTLTIIAIGFTVMSLNAPEVGDVLSQASSAQQSFPMEEVMGKLDGINWGFIATWFVLYFIAGYLLYASMFAALGAAVDNEADTNQFMLPITAIVLFALYAGIFSAENPDGSLAFWCSMVPLTSPIVMMVRLPFGVAWWELLTSFSLLVASIFGMAWVCSKIYRVGILMYGKKVSWKELWKWLRY